MQIETSRRTSTFIPNVKTIRHKLLFMLLLTFGKSVLSFISESKRKSMVLMTSSSSSPGKNVSERLIAIVSPQRRTLNDNKVLENFLDLCVTC
jgi:hypothetical protein